MRYQPAKAKKIYDVLWQQEICFQPSSYSEDTINRESLPCFFVREIESI